jgi:hypothetical protein
MVNFCAMIGCGNRGDRNKDNGFLDYQQLSTIKERKILS